MIEPDCFRNELSPNYNWWLTFGYGADRESLTLETLLSLVELISSTLEFSVMAAFNPSKLARSDMWFDDGNIVLVAEHVAFKVHRGQLERHSDIFQDLFSVPQPDNQVLFDNRAWVQLHDSPSDLLYLLRALYDGL